MPDRLDHWLDPLLSRLAPAARAELARSIARDLKASQAARIRANVEPDGAAMTPRKPQRIRDLAGKIKRGAMFRRVGTIGALDSRANASAATVFFIGRLARIAEQNQAGGDYPVRPGGPIGNYPARILLGFSDADRALIEDRVLGSLAAGL